MAKKHFQRALSVGLSLALCAGMVAPGFAATFGELQGAIDSGNSVYKDGYSDEKQGSTDEETYKIKVEAGKDGEGKDTRIVTLYEDVEFDKGKDNLKSTGEQGPGYGYSDGKAGIVIGGNTEAPTNNVTLDLNGHDIDLNPGWEVVLDKEGAEPWNTEPVKYEWTDPTRTPPTQETGTPTETPTGTPTETPTGTPTHTIWATDAALNQGDVIYVAEGSKLTVKDSEAKWTGFLDASPSSTDNSLASSVPEYVGGKITGSAMNSAINNQGTLIMDGGEISGNASNYTAGIKNNGIFEMNDGVIRNNKTAVRNTGDFTMNGGQISENFGSRGAVELWAGGSFTMNGGLIAGNGTSVSTLDSGNEYGDLDSTVKIHGGTITGNVVRWLHSSSKYSKLYALSNLGTVALPEDSDPVSVNKDGSIDFPAGTRIEKGNTESVGVSSIHVDEQGNMTGQFVSKTENSDKSVTITDTKGGNHEITDTNNGKVTVDKDGTTTVPEGGKVTDKDGNETTYPDGTTISKDGTVNGEKENGTTDPSVTKDKETGDVTIDDGKGNQTNVDVPDDKKADVDSEGKTHVPGGSEQPVEVKKDGEDEGTKVTAPEDTDIVVNPDGSVDVPAGGKVTDKDGNEYELPEGGKITEDGKVVDKDGNPVEPKKDDNGSGGSQGGGNGVTGGNGEADVIVIDGVEVPLSGLVSVEDVLDVLYRLAEGVDGGRDEVVAWAVENGIIDDETDVEELVTVAALRAILANYARAFELDVDVTTLATLTGEDDDIVMNCDEVIDEFFTKAEEDEAA